MSGLGEMGNLLKQAQEMQRQLEKAKTELKEARIEGRAGGGVVRLTLNGDRTEVTEVHVDPSVFEQSDASLVADLLRSALGDALRRAKVNEEETLSKLTGGLNLPGLA
ncbi:MAG: YbaB/EbfC family nucleoid-associated protein [Planctomycetota bacterium]